MSLNQKTALYMNKCHQMSQKSSKMATIYDKCHQMSQNFAYKFHYQKCQGSWLNVTKCHSIFIPIICLSNVSAKKRM